MLQLNRRRFLRTAAVGAIAGAGMAVAKRQARAAEAKRKFTMDLRCGSIGVRADQREAIRLAAEYGFESVEPAAGALAGASEAELSEVLEELKAKGLVWGAAGMPVDFRREEDRFQQSLKRLPEVAAALERAGVTRIGTWLSPGHNTLTYMANFRQHARRLREVAKVCGDHGIRFGLEYVGPKTSWTRSRFPFIHTMAETKDLIAEIGCDNVGFVLDSWHWYTAHETAADLLTLANRDVVACDLNDAPAGLAVDEQIDNQRELPAATGVIDLGAFLGALVKIGYDGPIRAEPFNKALTALDNPEAMAATAAAMKQAFALADPSAREPSS